jgi:putative thiamine transport system permease protein
VSLTWFGKSANEAARVPEAQPVARPAEPVGWVGLAPPMTIALLTGPVLAGLAGVLLPAFGWLPALGGTAFSLDAWRALLDWPGLAASVRLSLGTGFAATLISLGITLLFVAGWQGTRSFQVVMRLLSPLLSVPHAAAAFGLAFLLAPSGWVARALSPWATGWERPPDLALVGDPWGLALTAGLVAKEVPFLLLMTLAALAQADSLRSAQVARSLGYGRVAGWLKVVLPRVYGQVRLPVLAVLAYSLSVVDMAMILGPSRPPTLAVQVVHWLGQPDLAFRFQAAAAATLQAGLVGAAVGAWWAGERLVARLGRAWTEGGGRGAGLERIARPVGLCLAVLAAAAVLAGLAGLAVWSVAGAWQFPDALPSSLSRTAWEQQAASLVLVAGATAAIGLAATAVALALTVACLEAEHRKRRAPGGRGLAILYLPLLVPQVAFLPGLQTFMLILGMGGGFWVVVAAHVVFVLPYVFLALADPWRAWDGRIGTAAAALGASPARILWAVRLPMLLRPVLAAAALGFAVSVAQYLPTLIIGGGRVATLTTEAIALAAGANRRVIGVYALAQVLAPMAGFALALAVPALVFRNRRGLAL